MTSRLPAPPRPARFGRLAPFAFAPLLFTAGCEPTQSPECVEYVACQQAVDRMTGTDTEAVWSQYDADGSCWSDPLTASSCTAGCIAGLESAKQLFDQVPVECGGDFVVPDAGLPDGGDVGGDGGPLEPPASATVTLGSSGGVIEVRGLVLDIPAGAVPDGTTITVTNTGQPAPAALAYTPLFTFEPEGLVFQVPAQATFELPFSAAGQDVAVYWTRLGEPTIFEPIGGFSTGETLTASVAHFSSGYVGVASGDGGDGGVVPGPVTVSAVEPAILEAGPPAKTITVYGSGFLPTGTVTLSGTPLVTTVVSATEATAEVPVEWLRPGSYLVHFQNDAWNVSSGEVVLEVAVSARGDVLLEQDVPVGPIAVDATHVYYATASSSPGVGDAQVLRLSRTGGAAEVLASDLYTVHDIELDADFIYFTTNGTVLRMRKDGSGLSTVVGSAPGATALVLSGSELFYKRSDGSIGRAAKDGTFATSLGFGLGAFGEIAVDDVYVYVSELSSGGIKRIRRDGSETAFDVIYVGEQNVRGLVTLDGMLYWLVSGTGLTGSGVRAGPVDGGASATALSESGYNPRQLLTDGARLYWHSTAELQSVALDGSDYRYLTGGQGAFNSIALAPDAVYGSTYGTPSRILSTPKPGGMVSPDGGVPVEGGDAGVDDGGIPGGGSADGGIPDDGIPDDGGPTSDGGAGGGLWPSPIIFELSSTEVRQGTNDLPLRILFDQATLATPETVIRVNGAEVPSQQIYSNSVTALVPASMLATAGSLEITAYTPGGGESNALVLDVVATGNHAPSVSHMSPAVVAQGTAGQTLVNAIGSGFVSGAQCFVGMVPVQVSNQHSTAHGCVLYAANLATAGDFPVRIVNPGPGGGASLPVTLTISGTNPAPNLVTASVTEVGTGTADLYIDLGGDGLLPSTLVHATKGGETFGLPFRYGGANAGNVLVPAALLETPGALVLTATNPGPGGGSGQTVTVEVVAGNPTPQLVSVQPYQLSQGVSGQELTLTGSGFTAETLVGELTTSTGMLPTFVSSTELRVTVPDWVVASAGQRQFYVTTPAPGGGTSAQRTVVVAGALQIHELVPAQVTAGSGDFTLTVWGDGLDQEGYRLVWIGETPLEPFEVAGSSWSVTVPASLIAQAGTLPVRAMIEGRGESNTLELVVVP